MTLPDAAPDLVELHRLHAALVNPQCHWDIAQMSDVERQTAITDVLEQIESERISALIIGEFRNG